MHIDDENDLVDQVDALESKLKQVSATVNDLDKAKREADCWRTRNQAEAAGKLTGVMFALMKNANAELSLILDATDHILRNGFDNPSAAGDSKKLLVRFHLLRDGHERLDRDMRELTPRLSERDYQSYTRLWKDYTGLVEKREPLVNQLLAILKPEARAQVDARVRQMDENERDAPVRAFQSRHPELFKKPAKPFPAF